jgi:protoporphyrinogen oxidase
MVRGALTTDTDETNHHYLTRFRYPRQGGFGAFMKRLADGAPVVYSHDVTEVDVVAKRIRCANGEEAGYDTLVSSLPLPELIRRIPQTPLDVRQAADRLSCSSVVLVSLGVDRADLSPFHWFYIYDEDIPFARVNLPHNVAPTCAPEGCGGIQAEIYFSRYKPLWASIEELTEQTIAGLTRIGVLRPDDTILARDARIIRYANVIFDHDRRPALDVVHGFLKDQNIHYCGRYGEWAYFWTDDAILSGKHVAERILGN